MTKSPEKLSAKEYAAAAALTFFVHLLAIRFVSFRVEAGDGQVFITLAKNLLEHGTFSLDVGPPYQPTVYRSPLYPMFLAGHFALFGDSLIPPRISQALCASGATCVLSWTVGRLSSGAERMTLWFLAASPVMAAFSAAILSEQLCTVFLVIGFAVPLVRRLGWPRFLISGAFLGLAILARDALKLLPFFVVLSIVVPVVGRGLGLSGSRNDVLRAALLLAFGTALAVAPWSVRNRLATGQWVATTQGRLGVNLWVGAWETNDRWTLTGIHKEIPRESYRNLHEKQRIQEALELTGPERDAKFLDLFVERFQQEPFVVIGRWFLRIPSTWTGTRYNIFAFTPSFLARETAIWYVVKGGLFILNLLIAVGGLAGLIVAVHRGSPIAWLAVPLVYTFLLYLPLHSTESRYSQPAYPFLIAMTGYLLHETWLLRSRTKHKPQR